MRPRFLMVGNILYTLLLPLYPFVEAEGWRLKRVPKDHL